jgi:16S rRNA processing protein RimM
MSAMPAAPERLRAARVQRAHGVHGEVRVEPLGGDAQRFARGTRLHVEGQDRALTVRSARAANDDSVLLSFEELDTPEAAHSLIGAYLCVDVAAARRLGDDEWFVWQLVGLTAVTPQGEAIGEVIDVEAAVGNDVLVVRTRDGMRRFPMVRDFVGAVSVGSGRVTLTPWPEDSV